MMEVLDLTGDLCVKGQKGTKVLFSNDKFKIRFIDLPAGGTIPTCEMSTNVMFYVVEGKVEVTVNGRKVLISEKQCLVTEPATLSMESVSGAKLMGVQI